MPRRGRGAVSSRAGGRLHPPASTLPELGIAIGAGDESGRTPACRVRSRRRRDWRRCRTSAFVALVVPQLIAGVELRRQRPPVVVVQRAMHHAAAEAQDVAWLEMGREPASAQPRLERDGVAFQPAQALLRRAWRSIHPAPHGDGCFQDDQGPFSSGTSPSGIHEVRRARAAADVWDVGMYATAFTPVRIMRKSKGRRAAHQVGIQRQQVGVEYHAFIARAGAQRGDEGIQVDLGDVAGARSTPSMTSWRVRCRFRRRWRISAGSRRASRTVEGGMSRRMNR